MLGQRRRRWANIKPVMVQRFMFAENSVQDFHNVMTQVDRGKNNHSGWYYLLRQQEWQVNSGDCGAL